LAVEGLGQIPVARLELLEQPHVLDGDHGLVGEGLEEGDLAGREASYLAAAKEEGPGRHAVAEEGQGERRPVPESSGDRAAKGKLGLGVGEVFDVNRRDVHDGSAGHPAAVDRIRESDGDSFHGRTVTGDDPELILLDEQQHGVRGLAEPAGRRDERIEHGLQICLGGRDHPEDLAGRRLLGQRLGEIAVARLQLSEHARVLDGDDGLVGEGLQQRDPLVGEAADHPVRDTDDADRLPAAQERHRDHALHVVPVRGDPRELGAGVEVRNMDDRAIEDGNPHRIRPIRRPRESLDEPTDALGRDVFVSDQVEELAVVPHHEGGEAAAEPEGVAGDRR